ncbi:MAG TPA: YbhB/YbcL family Raf kinase inhibitor-like protein [bacterium]|jgi:Raf kinase inhibitor-like YbhB/YbcL family protein|nr:YbhB/YbcL family Raf kinase inhibitor-like protein [bacterium]
MRTSFGSISRTLLGAVMVLGLMAQAAGAFELKSSDIKEGATMSAEHIFNSFGCQGGNLSPELKWSKGPEGTLSYALTLYDPDAPTGSGWWHWVVFNIPADVRHLPKGFKADDSSIAGLVQSRTDFGKPGYGGPCPPPGAPHHYIFTVYALKVKSLDLDATASGAMVGYYINANKLAESKITALYSR